MNDDIGPWYWSVDNIRRPFNSQFQEIVAFHRLFRDVADKAFVAAAEEARGYLNPEYNDEGDVWAAAEVALGTNPFDVSQHLGLMALTRAISLAEVTIARAAASFFTDAEGVVFTNGKAWTRPTASSFYRSVLKRPFDLDTLGMDAIAELRNTYAHGYGDFRDASDAKALEARLLDVIGDEPASTDELEAGYGEALHVLERAPLGYFGDSFLKPVAHLSPLATYRLLGIIDRTVQAALDAVTWGPQGAAELATSRFAKEWAKSHGDPDIGDTEVDYEGRVQLRFKGKRVDLLDAAEPVGLLQRMRDGFYTGRVQLRRDDQS